MGIKCVCLRRNNQHLIRAAATKTWERYCLVTLPRADLEDTVGICIVQLHWAYIDLACVNQHNQSQ